MQASFFFFFLDDECFYIPKEEYSVPPYIFNCLVCFYKAGRMDQQKSPGMIKVFDEGLPKPSFELVTNA